MNAGARLKSNRTAAAMAMAWYRFYLSDKHVLRSEEEAVATLEQHFDVLEKVLRHTEIDVLQCCSVCVGCGMWGVVVGCVPDGGLCHIMRCRFTLCQLPNF